MKTIDIIHNEHRALGAVLQALAYVVDALRANKLQPDFGLLAAMVDYITLGPETVHHPKEDQYLFARLRDRSPDAAQLIAKLEQEHQDGYAMTVTLQKALIHYQSVGAAGFAAFAEVVAKYLEFTWSHLNCEETELLPLARTALTAADWAAIDAEFADNFDPFAGADGEFAGLFSRIVNLTPAPYGLGPAAAT
ncbi:MAG: hemerythrin domain-containing protein [Rhodocyclales bacterium]|nr:hemerythrin domain-containing protein [Rhodocyclales bacterium]